ncbi:conjugal transfer protein TrbJ [Legionella birminghamensis]|uniref:Conjugal transfer protein TrbJ n=1 Tax=Legionella birminghamensis TaxID=28083 RepID=A0A378JZD7_9GAMM|nr:MULTISPECIES: P-type conjugative transfer protein TrbJ [Legionella]KTC71803.1 conjugal transfer protein TrbJ [Legionella birminghamensis]MCW8452557.1 P-type conjugative transfer protein TrbJ [Legionella quinlivanii]STX60841.1 Conjugal transfer protein trbJ precursor [Legionella birminghamensis]
MKVKLMILWGLVFAASASGTPVFDATNWAQNLKMIANQVQAYKNQLEQYNTMLENTKSLTSYQWDDANSVISHLINTTDTIDYYKQEAGSLDAYLNRYQSEEYYSNSKFSEAEIARLKQNQLSASVAQKRANDALLRGIDSQQKNLKSDAAKLKTLQAHAQNAEGQKQAIQAASQLASAENHQLLQIRSLMIAEHNANATRAASEVNKEAILAAGDERFRAGKFQKSKPMSW